MYIFTSIFVCVCAYICVIYLFIQRERCLSFSSLVFSGLHCPRLTIVLGQLHMEKLFLGEQAVEQVRE